MGEHPSSVTPTQSYTHTMHFRQLAWWRYAHLCAQCLHRQSNRSSHPKLMSQLLPMPWPSKLSRKGTSFKLVYTKSGPYNIKLTYKQLGCKVEKGRTTRRGKTTYTHYKCRMCRRKRSGRYTCLRKRFLVYVKSCYRRTWGWFRRYTRTSCRVTHYQVYRGYYH